MAGERERNADADADAGVLKSASTKNKYRKPKPWDTDDIDHWKVDKFEPQHSSGAFLEESSFATLFPAYRERYLREMWPLVTRSLEKHGVACELNLIEGSMTARTTRKTYDPFVIFRARDFIKLLARSVPVQQASKVLNDDECYCDIVKIGGFVRNRERFVKRRQRLIGPNGSTLKAIELLTDCYVLVQGNTVAAMGPHKGLKQVRALVEQCMQNVHPVYTLKKLMIRRELAKDPALAQESWDRFLPQFRKSNPRKRKTADAAVGRGSAGEEKEEEEEEGKGKEMEEASPSRLENAARKQKRRSKREYTPFPPPQPPSKIDLQLESGEYFMSKEQKRAMRLEDKRVKSAENAAEKRKMREREYEPPNSEELARGREKRRRAVEEGVQADGDVAPGGRVGRGDKDAKAGRGGVSGGGGAGDRAPSRDGRERGGTRHIERGQKRHRRHAPHNAERGSSGSGGGGGSGRK